MLQNTCRHNTIICRIQTYRVESTPHCLLAAGLALHYNSIYCDTLFVSGTVTLVRKVDTKMIVLKCGQLLARQALLHDLIAGL